MPAGNNTKVPAGFTYLGQFVDHDITLDLTSIGEKEADPNGGREFPHAGARSRLVYGLGPDGSRQLYARNPGELDGKNPGPKLLIGKTITCAVGSVTGDHRNDLAAQPRRLRADRRSSQRRKPARRANASGDAEVPQQGVRHQLAAAGTPAERDLRTRPAGS